MPPVRGLSPLVIIGFIVNTIRHPAKERTGPLMKSALGLVIMLAIASSLLSLRAAPAAAVLFEDFSYANKQQLKQHGWIIRTEPGWPGVPGALWREDGVTLVKDSSNNQVLRMTSYTDGPGRSEEH